MQLKKNILLFIIGIGVFLYVRPQGAIANSNPDSLVVYFRFDKSIISSEYMNNNYVLQKIDSLFVQTKVDSICITATSSPEGDVTYNRLLAKRRANAFKSYLLNKYPDINYSKINVQFVGEDWFRLCTMLEGDSLLPYRSKVLSELLRRDVDHNQKELNLKQIGGGSAWRYIVVKYLRKMRTVNFLPIIQIIEQSSGKLIEIDDFDIKENKETDNFLDKTQSVDSVADDTTNILVEPIVKEKEDTVLFVEVKDTIQICDYQLDTIKVKDITELPIENTYKQLFAIKTNLLFDVLTAINLEVEVPIGKRWSIAGEMIFPWWLLAEQPYCLQLINGTVEGRYWFGQREERDVMTGWFAGVHVGGGMFDIGLQTKGYQSKSLMLAGLSAGYAHSINKNGSLRMEYSLGVGYMQTNYSEYIPVENSTILAWKQDGKFSWFGPTRAKVSLVWMLQYKDKKGGEK